MDATTPFHGSSRDSGPGQALVMVRLYHEIALKGGNRAFFLNSLYRNLRAALEGTGAGRVQRRSMMGLIPLPDPSMWPAIRERLERVLGVERFGLAQRVAPSLEAIKETIAGQLEGLHPQSFRISAQRADKGFPLRSPQVNQELGGFVQGLTGLPVDLTHPDLDIRVHILRNEALVSLEQLPGPGGMPVGVGGRVAVLLSGGIDSPVASFQMLKRGCQALFIHFHSFPLVDGSSREKAVELVQLLTQYQFASSLLMVPFAELQKRIILSAPPAYRVILYRRFMVRIAEALAQQHRAQALVTGDSLGQVSSQTLENMVTIEAARKALPILRPLIGMDKEEIVDRARELGTYPISILPDQDCCSLFVPKHPVTRSRPAELEEMEAQMDVEGMVQEALRGVEERRFHWPEAEQRDASASSGEFQRKKQLKEAATGD